MAHQAVNAKTNTKDEKKILDGKPSKKPKWKIKLQKLISLKNKWRFDHT